MKLIQNSGSGSNGVPISYYKIVQWRGIKGQATWEGMEWENKECMEEN